MILPWPHYLKPRTPSWSVDTAISKATLLILKASILLFRLAHKGGNDSQELQADVRYVADIAQGKPIGRFGRRGDRHPGGSFSAGAAVEVCRGQR